MTRRNGTLLLNTVTVLQCCMDKCFITYPWKIIAEFSDVRYPLLIIEVCVSEYDAGSADKWWAMIVLFMNLFDLMA